MSFRDLGLSPFLLDTLESLDYRTPTAVQEQAIPAILAGRDVMAAAQTGTGKTAAFVLPLLQVLANANETTVGEKMVRTVILVPTRELAEQVMQSCQRYAAGLTLSCYAAYGGVNLGPQITRLKSGVDVLVATPGRLTDLFTKGAVRFRELKAVVLDEADRMLDLGFADDLGILFQALPRQRQTLLFSATFSDAIRALGKARLKQPLIIEASPRNTAAKSVKQWVVPVDKKRKTDLFLFMRRDRGWQQVLVFAKTKKGCDELVERLSAKQIPADVIHGDRPQASRQKALDDFKSGAIEVLVATDVAARGLDIDGLPQVVNFELPLQAEDYIHRIGRTGRAGARGEAISFVCADEAPLLAAIEILIKQKLSRDEEPGFEPKHVVPQTSGPSAKPFVKAAPQPRSAGTGRPSTNTAKRSAPSNWVDEFEDSRPARRGASGKPSSGPRVATTRAGAKASGKPRGR